MQAKTKSDEYIDVQYMPEAVLLNFGVMMKEWTGDKIYAAVSKYTHSSSSSKKNYYKIL